MSLQAEQMQEVTSISIKIVKFIILSENSCHYVSCSACNQSYFLLHHKMGLMLDGTTPEIQHRK